MGQRAGKDEVGRAERGRGFVGHAQKLAQGREGRRMTGGLEAPGERAANALAQAREGEGTSGVGPHARGKGECRWAVERAQTKGGE